MTNQRYISLYKFKFKYQTAVWSAIRLNKRKHLRNTSGNPMSYSPMHNIVSYNTAVRLLSQQTFVLMKTSSRRLDQDEYSLLTHTPSEDVFKTSSWRFQDVLQKCLQDIFKRSSRNFEDILKTSSRRLAKTSSRCLQNVFKTSCKTSSRHLQDVFQRCLQDVFKTYH